MKQIWGISILLVALSAPQALASLPSNCADESVKLSQLARQAHHLPQGFDQDIFGQWQHATKIQGHDVNVRVAKFKSGKFAVELKVEGWFKNFREIQPLVICTTNKPVFEIRAHLDGEDHTVEVEVKDRKSIELLEGRLSGLYLKK